MKTLSLVMIVRNEEKVIERCLNSVKKYIDYWVIVDTGSTDNTPDIIIRTLEGIPGELHREPWVNFGYNRTQSLEFAKGKADYLLLCDADEQLVFSETFDSDDLIEDAYLLSYVGSLDYAVPYLISNKHDWKYVGVTHEYLESIDRTDLPVKYDKITILDFKDGGFKQGKFERDIQLLEEGLKQEPDNSRYKFYLANSYRDVNNFQKAIKWYQRVIDDNGWTEEVTCAYENMGYCYENLGEQDKAISIWLSGYEYNTSRMECLYNAVRLFRIQSKPHLAYHLGMLAKSIPYPEQDILFVKRDYYTIEIFYELSISSYYVGDLETGYQSCKKVLSSDISQPYFDSTIRNLYYYREKISSDSFDNVLVLFNFVIRYLQKYPEDKEVNDLRNDFLSLLVRQVGKKEINQE